jgi:vanillate O-demethylase monooxygenase subunit
MLTESLCVEAGCRAKDTGPYARTSENAAPSTPSQGSVCLTPSTVAHQGGAVARVLTNTDPALRRCWHPVARREDVGGQPHVVLLLGEPYVLYRVDGEVRAFEDRCPHRRCPLSIGHCADGVLQCAYHGWRFDRSGRCVEIPALGPGATLPPAARLTPPAAVAEAAGMVFLAPEVPITPLGTIPEADDPSFAVGVLPTLRARGSAGLLADNFLDVAHFPFVHTGTFGAAEAAEVAHFAVARDDWSFTVAYEHPFAHREDPGVAAGIRPLVQTRRLTYTLSAPFHLRLRIDFVDAGGSNVIGFFIQPETDETCRLFTTLWRDDLGGDEARMAEAVAFELDVLREDLRIQEAYHELTLPLDPTAEVHTRADRATLELRRVLADLVAAAHGGTA